MGIQSNHLRHKTCETKIYFNYRSAGFYFVHVRSVQNHFFLGLANWFSQIFWDPQTAISGMERGIASLQKAVSDPKAVILGPETIVSGLETLTLRIETCFKIQLG